MAQFVIYWVQFDATDEDHRERRIEVFTEPE